MDVSLFDFDLPDRLIAQEPASRRDNSRLLVYNRAEDRLYHARFHEITDYLPFPCRMIRNNAAVLRARLFGRRPSGGAVECLLLKACADDCRVWDCLLKPGKKLPPGSTFSMEGEFSAEVLAKLDSGEYRVRFSPYVAGESVTMLAQRIGTMPLPPYIRRERNDARERLDAVRYQTTYADPAKTVAAAAPTAGLHFTDALNQDLLKRGASFIDITLHVGLGTFKPIEVKDVKEHPIHTETYEIPAAARQQLEEGQPACRGQDYGQGRRQGQCHDQSHGQSLGYGQGPSGARVCIGTTSVRSVEDYARKIAELPATSEDFFSQASIYIYPPASFRMTDHLITNFHLPRSTLLCLISAFLEPGGTGGIAKMQRLYREAIEQEYRFFSYGDAMLII